MPVFRCAVRAFSVALLFLSVTVAVSAQSVAELKKQGAVGNATAQTRLGWAYAHGEGVPRDEAEAARWWRKAADQGDAKAQFNLGGAYYYGRGVSKDVAEALRWWRKAADQGHAKAQANLGWAYAEGEGVPKDVVEAARWYRKAADQGFAEAQWSLGVAYYNGTGLPQDYGEAIRWWRKAADQGNAKAQYNLAVAYNLGKGVPQDYAEAMRWLGKAADQGDADARDKLAAEQAARQIRQQQQRDEDAWIYSYWPTTIRVDTDMDSFWLSDEERTCWTYPNDKGRVAFVACSASGSHRDHNIPVKFWGDVDRNTVSDWKCRREKSILSDEFVCRAID
jgi:TPR repeat protein